MMANPFKAGDRVRCVTPNLHLHAGMEYRVTRTENNFIWIDHHNQDYEGGWDTRRFVPWTNTESKMDPAWSLDEIEQAQALVQEISNG